MSVSNDKIKPSNESNRAHTPSRIRSTRDRHGSHSPSVGTTSDSESENGVKPRKRPIYDQLSKWEEENTIQLRMEVTSTTLTSLATDNRLINSNRAPNATNGNDGKSPDDKHSIPTSSRSKRKLGTISNENTPSPISKNLKKRRSENGQDDNYYYEHSSSPGNSSSPLNSEHRRKKIKNRLFSFSSQSRKV